MTSKLVTDAHAITGEWRRELDLAHVLGEYLSAYASSKVRIDLVALGKASVEMAKSAEHVLGSTVQRRLIISDYEGAASTHDDPAVLSGDHPIAGPASLRAGEALVAFLEAEGHGDLTLFLVSGGASSLCAWPSPPLTLLDLRGLWDAALATGADITTLNRMRAATSSIAGGAVLRHVRSARSQSLIMVDNVVSGAEWVASGLTYDYRPTREQLEALLDDLALSEAPLGDSMRAAYKYRSSLMAAPRRTQHVNTVVASPDLVHDLAVAEARRRGYRVHDMGSHVQGDVTQVSAQWGTAVRALENEVGPQCVLGVGEVTVRVIGEGSGGRCQEFAWRMARELASLDRDAAFAARATDGRDFLSGVAGAWVERATRQRAEDLGIDWDEIAANHDSHRGLSELGQLFEGAHTGWNLCDLYVAVL